MIQSGLTCSSLKINNPKQESDNPIIQNNRLLRIVVQYTGKSSLPAIYIALTDPIKSQSKISNSQWIICGVPALILKPQNHFQFLSQMELFSDSKTDKKKNLSLDVATVMASSEFTPEIVLNELYKEYSDCVTLMKKLCVNSNLPLETLEFIVKSMIRKGDELSVAVLKVVVGSFEESKNPGTPASILRLIYNELKADQFQLAIDSDLFQAIAHNINTPVDILLELSKFSGLVGNSHKDYDKYIGITVYAECNKTLVEHLKVINTPQFKVALNPNTSQQELHNLFEKHKGIDDNNSKKTLANLARNLATPENILRDLYKITKNNDDQASLKVLANLACNPKTPKKILQNLFDQFKSLNQQSEDEIKEENAFRKIQVLRRLGGNPNLDPKSLSQLATSVHDGVLAAVAKNPSSLLQDITPLFFKSRLLACRVAKNPNVEIQNFVFKQLFVELNKFVDIDLKSKQEEESTNVLYSFLTNKNLDESILTKLSKSENWTVLYYVAEHSNTKLETLEKIAGTTPPNNLERYELSNGNNKHYINMTKIAKETIETAQYNYNIKSRSQISVDTTRIEKLAIDKIENKNDFIECLEKNLPLQFYVALQLLKQ